MRLPLLTVTLVTALSSSGCESLPSTEKPNPFPRPPASLLAPVDRPTLLDDCLCGTARELKDGLKARLLEGASTETLLAGYIAENGEEYLAAPAKQGFNWVIWIFPSVAFVALGTAFWFALQRLTRRRVVTATVAETSVATAKVARYRDEIERQVNDRAI